MLTPRGIRNNNPGNIRKSPTKWIGEVEGEDPSFITFQNMAYGVRAIAVILIHYEKVERLSTIRAMVSRWAPPNENNTPAYVEAVTTACGISADASIVPLQHSLLIAMVEAITVHENGPGNWIEPAAFNLGVGNALGTVPLSAVGGYHAGANAT